MNSVCPILKLLRELAWDRAFRHANPSRKMACSNSARNTGATGDGTEDRRGPGFWRGQRGQARWFSAARFSCAKNFRDPGCLFRASVISNMIRGFSKKRLPTTAHHWCKLIDPGDSQYESDISLHAANATFHSNIPLVWVRAIYAYSCSMRSCGRAKAVNPQLPPLPLVLLCDGRSQQ